MTPFRLSDDEEEGGRGDDGGGGLLREEGGRACMAEAGGKPFLPGQYKVIVQITACTPGRIKSRSARRAKRSSRAK